MSDQINVNAIADTLNRKVDLPVGKSQSDIDYVVESQLPTSGNGYTWYRLYKSGWIEQGGLYSFQGTHGTTYQINLVKSFSDTSYSIVSGGTYSYATNSLIGLSVIGKNTNNFTIQYCAQTGYSYPCDYYWEAKGMSAQS